MVDEFYLKPAGACWPVEAEDQLVQIALEILGHQFHDMYREPGF